MRETAHAKAAWRERRTTPKVDAANTARRTDDLPLRQSVGPIQAGQADLSSSSRIWADLLIIDYSPAHAALGTRILLSTLRSVDE
jgi:hypothetical protein